MVVDGAASSSSSSAAASDVSAPVVWPCILADCTCGNFRSLNMLRSGGNCSVCSHSRETHDYLTVAEAVLVRQRAAADAAIVPCQCPGCHCTSMVAGSIARICESCSHMASDHRLPTADDRRRAAEDLHAKGQACVVDRCTCTAFALPEKVSCTPGFKKSNTCAKCPHSSIEHRALTQSELSIQSLIKAASKLSCRAQVCVMCLVVLCVVSVCVAFCDVLCCVL